MAFESFHSLPNDQTFIIDRSGSEVVIKDIYGGSKIKLTCEECKTGSLKVFSVSLTRCVCELTTAGRRHPKFATYAGTSQDVRFNVKELAADSSAARVLFPLKVKCSSLQPGITIKGKCSKGERCPLQHDSLKKLFSSASACELCCSGVSELHPPSKPNPQTTEGANRPP